MQFLCFLTIIIICTSCTSAYFNLFISSKEVKKLMGLDIELYYVKEGIVNNYAVGYVLTVNSTIEELEFTWQSLMRIPVRLVKVFIFFFFKKTKISLFFQLQYNILIDYDVEQNALLRPSLNIPSVGVMPFSQRSFKIFLHCTGNQTLQVQTEIHFKILMPHGKNETNFSIKRNKICMKPKFGSNPNADNATTKTILLRHGKDSGTFIAAMFAFIITITVATVIGLSYIRNKKRFPSVSTSLRTHYVDNTAIAYQGPHNVVIKLDQLGGGGGGNNPHHRPSSAASGSYATINSFNKYQIPIIARTYNWLPNFRQVPPSPYATTQILHQGDNGVIHYQDSTYEKAESVASSKISYYASSQVTQLCTLSTPSKSFHSKASTKKIQADKLKEISVPDKSIECDRLIFCGTYGRVYSGNLHEGAGHLRPVLVKTVVGEYFLVLTN